jgi:hypothetical protein
MVSRVSRIAGLVGLNGLAGSADEEAYRMTTGPSRTCRCRLGRTTIAIMSKISDKEGEKTNRISRLIRRSTA